MIYLAYDSEARTSDVYLIIAPDIDAAIKAFMEAYNKHNNTVIGAYSAQHINDHEGARIGFDGMDFEIDPIMTSDVIVPDMVRRTIVGKFNKRFMELFMGA